MRLCYIFFVQPDAPHPPSGLEPERLRPLDHRGQEIDLEPLAALLESLIARWRPTQVRLFGSRARGEATPESDWDLFVVVPDDVPEDELDPLIAWQIRKHARVPVDIIPCHERDFVAYRDTCQSLAYEAAHHGVLLYER